MNKITAPVILTTKGLPRALICGILRENYKNHTQTQSKVEDKTFEANIELFKERQKTCWKARYKKHKELWDWYFGDELQTTQERWFEIFTILEENNSYPKHLGKNLQEALDKMVLK